MKSDHLYTFPSPERQDFDIFSISPSGNTWSQTLTSVNIPMKHWSKSKPPPGEVCSWANVSDPPDLITWLVFKESPCAATNPSLYNFHEPAMFSQDAQMWCHFPSFADTEVNLQEEKKRRREEEEFVWSNTQTKHIVEPLSGHLGDRRKWPLLRGLKQECQCMEFLSAGTKKSGR